MKIVPVFFALLTGGFGRKHQKSRTHQSNSKEALPKTCHDIFTKSAEKCQVADNGFYEIKVRTNCILNISLRAREDYLSRANLQPINGANFYIYDR